jgi:hypothetical protein
MIKSGRMRWVAHVARMGEMVGKPEVKIAFGNLDAGGRSGGT